MIVSLEKKSIKSHQPFGLLPFTMPPKRPKRPPDRVGNTTCVPRCQRHENHADRYSLRFPTMVTNTSKKIAVVFCPYNSAWNAVYAAFRMLVSPTARTRAEILRRLTNRSRGSKLVVYCRSGCSHCLFYRTEYIAHTLQVQTFLARNIGRPPFATGTKRCMLIRKRGGLSALL